MCGFASTIVAGGTESMSLVPMGGHKIAPNPTLMDRYPDVYLSTGLVAENHARESGITREEQDRFALTSHQRAIAAIDSGRFVDEIVPIKPPPWSNRRTARTAVPPSAGHVRGRRGTAARYDAEALAKLRPLFTRRARVTAGNSSQMSDGAAAVVVTSARWAKERGLTPLARFVGFATAGVEPERFGIGPVPAMQKVLKRAGLTLDQIDLVELNEAFAAQVLACLREMPIDPAAAERQRRRDRARPSARVHRRQADDLDSCTR